MSEGNKEKKEDSGDFILDDVDNAPPRGANEEERAQGGQPSGEFSVDEKFILRILAQPENVNIPLLRRLVNSSAWFHSLVTNLGIGVLLWVYPKLPNVTPEKVTEYFNNPDAFVNDVVKYFNDLYTAREEASKIEELKNELKECSTLSELALNTIRDLSARYNQLVQAFVKETMISRLFIGSKVLNASPDELQQELTESLIKAIIGNLSSGGSHE